jgi:predicted O-linked N-acetylglucosamine transferase (SPINDLY family)
VVLDTFRWSGGNTSLDAFASATPVVTLEGRFMRGRQTAAMLRLMELGELVAAGPEEYIQTALGVAADGARQAELRRAIAERRRALFGRADCLAAFQEALLAVGAARADIIFG